MFYKSKTHPVLPLLGDRDLLAEMVEECHKNDIYLVAYINVHWAPPAFYEKYPQWHQVSSSGRPVELGYGQGGPMCTNIIAYREDWIRPIVNEITSEYDIDGIFLDGPSRRMESCYCSDCKTQFKEAYGHEMPT